MELKRKKIKIRKSVVVVDIFVPWPIIMPSTKKVFDNTG